MTIEMLAILLSEFRKTAAKYEVRNLAENNEIHIFRFVDVTVVVPVGVIRNYLIH